MAYWFVPISKTLNEILPIIELQGTFLAMTLASFVPLPLLVDFEFIYSTASPASTAKDFSLCCSSRIHCQRDRAKQRGQSKLSSVRDVVKQRVYEKQDVNNETKKGEAD
jgi:hypothetical protein